MTKFDKVLFNYDDNNDDNNSTSLFLFEDYYSLKDTEPITNGVVDFVTSQIISKATTNDAIIFNSLIMKFAICIIKNFPNQTESAYEMISKFIMDASVQISFEK